MAKERRKWDSKEKVKIVIEGLKENASISELCAKHKIIQTQYYKWKEVLLKNAWKAFEGDSETVSNDTELQEENKKLRDLVLKYTLEAEGIKS